MVIERAGALRGDRIYLASVAGGGHCLADRGGQALAERTGGDLDARGVAELGVARGERTPLAQMLEIVEFDSDAGQVELDVLGEAGMAAGQHEAVAADPLVVTRGVPHYALVERVGQRRQAHRGTGVAVAGVLD